MKNSISHKLTIAVTTIGIILAIVQATFFAIYLFVENKSEIDGKVNNLMTAVKPQAELAVFRVSQNSADTILSGLSQFEFITYAKLVDETGNILAEKKFENKSLTDISNFFSGEEKVIEISLDNYYTKQPGFGKIIVKINYDAFYASIIRNTITIFITGLFMATIILLSLYSITNKIIIIPLKELENKVEAIANGTLDLKLTINRDDELGTLAKAFNKMRINLRKLINNLEIKIKERTFDAEQAKRIAEASTRSKSDFLANVSHEIRTPINAINGFTELLISKNKDNPELQNYLNKILINSNLLLELINNILLFSKIDAQKIEMKFSIIELNKVFNDIQNTYHETASLKGIALSFDISETLPTYIQIDPIKLRQVLVNIVENAIKFTHEGFIKFKAYPTFDDNEETFTLNIDIEDSGIGIPADKISNIFEVFEQVNSNTETQNTGLGLGLALTKHLLKMLNGDINVTSNLGNGAIFHIKIFGLTTPSPDKLKEITITQFPDAHIEFHNCSIVVCDEVLSDRRQIVTKLNELNFDKITEVSSYDKLIKSLKERKTDILFLGIGFSAIRAKEVINTIRSMNELAEIKIIAITTSISEQTENYIFLCDGYINKPIITTELLNVIKKHLVYKINKIELITEVRDENIVDETINDDLDLLPEYLLDDLISAIDSESEKAIKNILKELEVYTPNLAIDFMDLLKRKKYNLIAEEINKIKLTRSNNA